MSQMSGGDCTGASTPCARPFERKRSPSLACASVLSPDPLIASGRRPAPERRKVFRYRLHSPDSTLEKNASPR
jgi:hypothetical protein